MKATLAFFALVCLALVSARPAKAQTAISVDGVVESTVGGFRFPDGKSQASAASAGPAPVADTGQRRCWEPDAVAAETSCAGTGQDGEKQAGVDRPAPRFTDNLDGTVVDNLTGLIWLRTANCVGQAPFDIALDFAELVANTVCGLTDGSMQGDWRVPSVRELSSLFDYDQPASPALPPGHPFVDVRAAYWSSTTFSSAGKFAWRVEMNGEPFAAHKEESHSYFWAVRGGESVAAGEVSADGAIESTVGGFGFPDGSVQVTAAASGAPVPITGQTICYETASGDAIDCTDTGQDGEFRAGVAWPVPRFVDNLDGTVTDQLTGLIWLQDASCDEIGFVSFESALAATGNLEQGFCDLTDGSSPGDWRVPSIKEILSLIDYERQSPALPVGNPFTGVISSSRYWSSTTSALDPIKIWSIELAEPFIFQQVKEAVTHRVWPVRGGR